MNLADIVPQRTRFDCGISALASLQGWSYEKARDVLGPQVTNQGACLLPMMPHLLAAGVAATYLLPGDRLRVLPEIADRQSMRLLPTSEKVHALLKGRRAIVIIPGQSPSGEVGAFFGHAIAWDGERAIECGAVGEFARPPREISFEDYPLYEALVLSDTETETRPAPIEARPATELEAADPAALAAIFDRHERVFLGFSGGKESVALAHMLDPWRDRVTLLWVNTGVMAPHMVEFVRGYGERFTLEEIASPNVSEHWHAMGTPAEVFAMGNITGSAQRRLQPWMHCCYVIRQEPVNAILRAQPGPCCFISGQRRQDQDGATVAGLKSKLPATVDVVMPLASWSETDVFAYIEAHGLTLPQQYAEGYRDSIECLVCPAPMNAERLRYLRRHHPTEATIATGAALAATDATMNAVGQILAITNE